MDAEADIVIIGGGVAGLTAAIAAQTAGLQSLVLERQETFGEPPGESLHPGIAPLVERLGILPAFEAAATGRFAGIVVQAPDRGERFQPFGATDGVAWEGYHVPRGRLAQVLGARALALGASIEFSSRAETMAIGSRGVIITTSTRRIRAAWAFDATGPAGFSARRDRSGLHRASRPQRIAYSYQRQQHPDERARCIPSLLLSAGGWAWAAPLGNGITAHVRLASGAARADAHAGRPQGNVRFADGTWVVARRPAHERLFRIGDTAMRLDPTSGKGVLRAMMTAMMAVHLTTGIVRSRIGTSDAACAYNDWVHQWFRHDVSRLNTVFSSSGQPSIRIAQDTPNILEIE